jgi:hypothetical protein
MHQLLDSLELQLREIVTRAGFILTDADESGNGDYPDLGRLEYRRDRSDPRTLLLDFCLIDSQQKFTATCWSPQDLVKAKTSASVESVAVGSRTWHYDSLTDPELLAGEVVAEVATWLE